MMCQLALFDQYKHRRRTNKARQPRRFWVRRGRTTAWWNNFLAWVVVEEEWKENFWMCRTNFMNLYSELHEYIQKKETVMCALIITQHLRALQGIDCESSGPFVTSLLKLKLRWLDSLWWQKTNQDSSTVLHYKFNNLHAQASKMISNSWLTLHNGG